MGGGGSPGISPLRQEGENVVLKISKLILPNWNDVKTECMLAENYSPVHAAQVSAIYGLSYYYRTRARGM